MLKQAAAPMMPCIVASMHPSLMEKERQQKSEILTPQQKVGWRSTVLYQTRLQTISPFSPFWKGGTWVKMLPFEVVITKLINLFAKSLE